MRNLFSSFFQSRIARPVAKWFRSVRRAKSERTISPEEFLSAFKAMMNDPEQARLYRRSLGALVLPFEGATGGTQHYIAEFDNTGAATVDSPLYDSGGSVGLGTTAPYGKIQIIDLSTRDTSPEYGVGALIEETGSPTTSSSSANYVAAQMVGRTKSESTSRTFSGVLYGNSSAVIHQNNGTLANAFAVGIWMQNSGGDVGVMRGVDIQGAVDSTKSVTEWAGIHVWDPGGSGSITTNYGIKIEPQTKGGDNYAIYSGGGKNYFGGNVGIGTTSPLGIFDISGRVVHLKPSGGDDTTQINQAISTVSANGGGSVILSGGVFNVGNLTGASNVHLLGAGRGATKLVYNGSHAGGYTMIYFPAGSTNFSIRDITWDYNLITPHVGYAGAMTVVFVDSYGIPGPPPVRTPCTNFTITDCSFINLSQATSTVGTYGVIIQAAQKYVLQRNIIAQPNPNGWTQAAILLTQGNDDQPEQFEGILSDNFCDGCGIDICGYNIKIVNNTFTNNRYGGVIFSENDPRCHDLEIVGNTVFNNPGQDSADPPNNFYHAGIENWAKDSIISWNNLFLNSGEGIFNAGQKCIISNNVCYNNGTGGGSFESAGITLGGLTGGTYDSSESIIIGNRCYDDQATKTQTYGIEDHYGQPSGAGIVIGINNLAGNKLGEMNVDVSSCTLISTTGGKVGIGTATPTQTLTVNGRVSASGYDGLGSSDVPSLDASKITSGTFSTSRIPSLDAGIVTSGQFNAARIPSLDASQIGSGIMTLARGGTGVACSGMLNCLNGQKKLKFGDSQLSSGTVTVNTGLSSVDFFMAFLVFGTTPSEYLSRDNASGGSVTVYSSDDTSDHFFDWIAVGT